MHFGFTQTLMSKEPIGSMYISLEAFRDIENCSIARLYLNVDERFVNECDKNH